MKQSFINVNCLNYIFIDEFSFYVNNYARYDYSKKSKIITKNYKHKHLHERKTLLSAIIKIILFQIKLLMVSLNVIFIYYFLKKT